jgi:hypothetical protein
MGSPQPRRFVGEPVEAWRSSSSRARDTDPSPFDPGLQSVSIKGG